MGENKNVAYLLAGVTDEAELFRDKWQAVSRIMYVLVHTPEYFDKNNDNALVRNVYKGDGLDFIEVELKDMPEFNIYETYITVTKGFGALRIKGKWYKIMNYRYLCGSDV